jgi:mannose-6-phosphate isomerase-like protein (cupin superfamily)
MKNNLINNMFSAEIRKTSKDAYRIFKNPLSKLPDLNAFVQHKEKSLGTGNIVMPSTNMSAIYSASTKQEQFYEIFNGYEEFVASIEAARNKMHIYETTIFFSDSLDSNKGFTRHYDQHDIYHWNCIGKAHWTVWDKKNDNKTSFEFILNEGDVVYIPSRFHHQVQSLTEKRASIALPVHD